MSNRNPSNTLQHYHGSHSDGCGCMIGNHIWDTPYENEVKSERWCICCEHFYPSDETEFDGLDSAIEISGSIINPKPISKHDSKGGIRKGKIVRRS
jgi:hypothetical protein